MNDTDKLAVWLIWSNEHVRWWAPKRHGYASHIGDAGRYTEASANEICNGAGAMPGRKWKSEIPCEVKVLAPEAITGMVEAAHDLYAKLEEWI